MRLNSRGGFPPYALARGASFDLLSITPQVKVILYIHLLSQNGGEDGIRTHGPLARIAGFQDQFHKPLGHLSTVAAARMQVLLYKNAEGLSTPPRKLFLKIISLWISRWIFSCVLRRCFLFWALQPKQSPHNSRLTA